MDERIVGYLLKRNIIIIDINSLKYALKHGEDENQFMRYKLNVEIDDNNIDAVIFSKSDLTLNGTGSLTITADAGHGIVSKDDLVLTSGTYEINAASHGFSGKIVFVSQMERIRSHQLKMESMRKMQMMKV